MSILQFVIGAFAGFAAVFAVLFLIFVYPYVPWSLKWFWWGLGSGFAVAMAIVAYYGVIIMTMVRGD